MTSPASDSACSTRTARRWLLGLEPFFEGGWLHKGDRARAWDVENELTGLSVLGDVTIDLSEVKSLPRELHIEAYALGRDVDIIVPSGTRVELTGRAGNDHLNNEVVSDPGESPPFFVRITGHTFLGDVQVRSDHGHS
jgi:predicted membrane protein